MQRQSTRAAEAPTHPGLGRIVLAAAIGAVGAWGILTWLTPRAASAPEGPARADRSQAAKIGAPVSPAPPAAPATPSPAPADAATPTPLDDAALVELAQGAFGFDCPGIAERGPQARAGFEFTCTNGERLRVYTVAGASPRVGPAH